MTEGWILLHRKLQDNPLWVDNNPFDMRSAWVDLLMMVNHTDVETVIDYKPFVVQRGQCLTSVRKLSVRWSWSKDRTLKYLKLLESLGMIIKESNNQRTLITIVNYGIYQGEQDTNKDTDKDTKRTRTRTRVRTQNGQKTDTGLYTGQDTGSPQTNNVNNINNDKTMKKNESNVNNNTPYSPPQYFPNDDLLDKSFSDFVDFRKKIRKPMTDKAIDLTIKRLNTLSHGDNDMAIKIIEQSIMQGWQGLFELHDTGTKKKDTLNAWVDA